MHDLVLDEEMTLISSQLQVWARKSFSTSDLSVLAWVVGETGERDGIPVAIREALAAGVRTVDSPVSRIPEVLHYFAQYDNSHTAHPVRDW
jgi:hypothetical protein